MDSRFTAEVVSQTSNPQQTSWVASHQDYSSEFVCHSRDSWPSEEKCGELLINNLLKGGRGVVAFYQQGLLIKFSQLEIRHG